MTRLRRLLDLYRARWGRLEAFVLVGWLVIGAALAGMLCQACSPAAERRARSAEGLAKAFCAEWVGQTADAGAD